MFFTGSIGFPISVVTPPSDKETVSYPFWVLKEKSFFEKVSVNVFGIVSDSHQRFVVQGSSMVQQKIIDYLLSMIIR